MLCDDMVVKKRNPPCTGIKMDLRGVTIVELTSRLHEGNCQTGADKIATLTIRSEAKRRVVLFRFV
ncbi:uncharacterized protein BCR38DRAFT_452438 [Pseudomassariella vexata]|uniref:Uncharacterized protein n=1 Tax=Pseudomassariella vexata TaxID=1141098 RepID=A0A1Y2D8A2_9PEZI|nr:uncharacterized protein BCR38DRAFT_452438 [Pseudomassariella vexata]ORY55491.1 hypothetical protein BCR38DRAFT_452438 [Pseudomassariella vexata]